MKKTICCLLAFLFLAGCASPLSDQNSSHTNASSDAISSSTPTRKPERTTEKIAITLPNSSKPLSRLHRLQFLSPTQFFIWFGTDVDEACGLYDSDTQSFEILESPYEPLVNSRYGLPSTVIDREQNTVSYYGPDGDLLRETDVPFATEGLSDYDIRMEYFPYHTAISPDQQTVLFMQQADDLSDLRFGVVDASTGEIEGKAADISGIFETEEFAAMLPDEEYRKRIEFGSVKLLRDNIAVFNIDCINNFVGLELHVLYDLEKDEILSFQTGNFYIYSTPNGQTFALSNLGMDGAVKTEGHTVWRVDFESSPVKFVPCDFEAQELAISPNGKYLLTVYDDYETPFAVTIRDARTLEVLEEFEFDRPESIYAWFDLVSAVSDDGQSVLFGVQGGNEIYLIQKAE